MSPSSTPLNRESVARRLLDKPSTDDFTRQHIGILLTLPEAEQDAILEHTAMLANRIPNMGPALAFEVVAKIGRYWARQERARGR